MDIAVISTQLNAISEKVRKIKKKDSDEIVETKPYAKATELSVAGFDIDRERGFTSVVLRNNENGNTIVGYAKRHLSEDSQDDRGGISKALIDGVKRYCKVSRRTEIFYKK